MMKQITCPHCGDTYPDFDVAHVCSKGPYAPKLKPKMNERIRELYLQAVEYSNGQMTFGDTREFFAEKFAELIVKECIDKIETYRIPVGNSAAGEMACEWTYDALKEIRDEIKEHFGVEE
jgi:hypothetical protein